MGNHPDREQIPIQENDLASQLPPKELEDENFIESVFLQTDSLPGVPNKNVSDLLHQRQITGKFSGRRKINVGQRYIPVHKSGRTLMRYTNRVFCGGFSSDGSIFMSATQDRRIRFYNSNTWKRIKEVVAGDVGWSIIDTDFSPDQRWLIYSGWSDYVNLCNVVGEHEIHEQLKINDEPYHFCLFSVKFSPDSSEIIGGSNDSYLYIFDLNRKELVTKILAHNNDINTVTYAEANNNNMILTGSDDSLCKVWDRRILGHTGAECVGVMIGHEQGITHINSKGDGRYFISNGKDQCIKLWDIRKMQSASEGKKHIKDSYDYRYGASTFSSSSSESDMSLMTYRSHLVTRTLIRCYFSPSETTGQRYIYTGSSDGIVYIYDVLTGRPVTRLEGHVGAVRDLSWHPNQPTLASTSWDGTVALWSHVSADKENTKVIKNSIADEDDSFDYS